MGKKAVKRAVRAAGPNISKKEMKRIVNAAGGNVKQAVNQISRAGANLSSGTTNMLIRQAEQAPIFRPVNYGTSKLAQAIQSMVPTRKPPGVVMRAGSMQSPISTIASPGFNPGGRTDKNRMIAGTVLRPNGSIAVRPMQATAPAAPAAPPPLSTATVPTDPVPTDTGDEFDYGNDFDWSSLFGDLFDYGSMFDDLQTDMMGMFEDLSSKFDVKDPIQLAALGKAYGGDLIRARQRQRKTRPDYLRNRMNNMAIGGANALGSLAFGGGVTI
jgi:hypothetical protein